MASYNDIARQTVDAFLPAGYRYRERGDMRDAPHLVMVMRGLPGSGKTTLSNIIARYAEERDATTLICSADDFFTRDDGTYEFQPECQGRAHEKCLERCIRGLDQARIDGPDIIIIDNTNLRNRDFEEYADLPPDHDRLEVIAFECPRNVGEMNQVHHRANENGRMIPAHKFVQWWAIWGRNLFDERNNRRIRFEDFMGFPQ